MNKMKYSKWEKIVMVISCAVVGVLAFPQIAGAMHIMEGYLPLGHSIVWSVISLPFLAFGVIGLRRALAKNKRMLILLAMSGAFIFVISSLKIPSVTGSCSHMTGTGLSAILFGPMITCVLGIIVLVFQAILLAHGGLTTLGANTFSMALAGPFITWVLYKCGKKANLNKKVNVFVAVLIGSFATYIITALQLAIAHPSETGGIAASAASFLGVFAPTQVPLSILEGVLTVLIVIGMESFAEPELREIAFIEGSK